MTLLLKTPLSVLKTVKDLNKYSRITVYSVFVNMEKRQLIKFQQIGKRAKLRFIACFG